MFIDDIVSDDRIINNDIIGYSETENNPSDSTIKIMETSNSFNTNFNNNINKYLGLAYGYRNNVTILDKFDVNEVHIFSLKKHTFADRAFTLKLVYRKQSMQMQEFFQMIQYFTGKYSKGIRARKFSYGILKVSENKLFRYFPRPFPDG